MQAEQIHASCVAAGGRAALIRGASGTGKSTLALEMIAMGAELVADDRVCLERGEDGLMATPPATIAGLIEARGAGLIPMPWRTAPVRLIVDMDHRPVERLTVGQNQVLLGISCPVLFGKGRVGLAGVVMAVLRYDVIQPE